jgi:hypothetical protein
MNVMSKKLNIYLVVCLAFLQLLVPFIHAHANGKDSYQEHNIHLHYVDSVSDNRDTLLKVVFEPLVQMQSLQQHSIKQHQVEQATLDSTVFTVSNATRFNVGLDLDAILLSVLVVFFSIVLVKNTFPSGFFKPYSYQKYYLPSSPRAPPL